MIYPKIEDYRGKRIHMIGAGGTSMHGLALMLSALGYEVTGSDRGESPFTEKLKSSGIPVTIGQKAENVHGAGIVVYSAAIKPENPERAEARALGIPELERSELLGQISAHYNRVVGVAGCHGKTTITSMVAKLAMDAGLQPTVHVGGFVDFMGGGIHVGKDELFITEACEYVDSYLHLRPTIEVISNIDNDHLDYFKCEENIYKSFESYVGLLPEDGVLVACVDDEKVRRLASACDRTVVTYGISGGDYRAAEIEADDSGDTWFQVYERGEPLTKVTLAVPGEHNVRNALAALAVARTLGIPTALAVSSLKDYRLTRRRFELYGYMNSARVYHDYAHHPAEIAACLQGARSVCSGKLYVVFQCNSYTRAKTLFSKDVTCFKDADEVLVPDIYPGRETDDGTVHAKDMVKAIDEAGVNALYLPTFAEIKEYLSDKAKEGDIIITLGSGDVYKQTEMFLDKRA